MIEVLETMSSVSARLAALRLLLLITCNAMQGWLARCEVTYMTIWGWLRPHRCRREGGAVVRRAHHPVAVDAAIHRPAVRRRCPPSHRNTATQASQSTPLLTYMYVLDDTER